MLYFIIQQLAAIRIHTVIINHVFSFDAALFAEDSHYYSWSWASCDERVLCWSSGARQWWLVVSDIMMLHDARAASRLAGSSALLYYGIYYLLLVLLSTCYLLLVLLSTYYLLLVLLSSTALYIVLCIIIYKL